MKNRTNIFVSVVLLIVYGTVIFVAVPLHFHEDPLSIGGNGKQTIAQHDDAAHCHHRPADVHLDCTICSFVSHSSFSKVIAIVPQSNPKPVEYASKFFFAVIQQYNITHLRRGPPTNLA